MELWINQGIIIMVCITLWCHKLKMVATRLPAIKIWSRAMVNECSFCTELSEMTWFCPNWLHARDRPVSLSEHFVNESLLFWQIDPKVKFTISSLSTWRKSCLFSVLVSYFLKTTLIYRARRVVHSSLCCIFHASLCTIQSKKLFCADFHF